MPTAYFIHSGFLPSDSEKEAAIAASDGFDLTVKTARLGAEATVGYKDPDRVITAVEGVAQFWEDRDVEVVRVGDSLPQWLPKREALAESPNVSKIGDVQALARAGVLTDVDGVGETYAQKITDALIEHTDFE